MKLKKELVENVRNWAEKRGIYENGKIETQFLKLIEELSELASAKDIDELIDAIGDSVVVIINLIELINKELKTENFKIENFEIRKDEKYSSSKILIILGIISKKIVRKKYNEVIEDLKILLEKLRGYENLIEEEGENVDINVCLTVAYNEIKDRKGKLLNNGNFVKEEDLKNLS